MRPAAARRTWACAASRLACADCVAARAARAAALAASRAAAAEAAEAAGAQDKFWEMHDWIFEHQETIEDQDLLQAGEDLGLDVAKFMKDLKSQSFLARVKEDFSSGVRSGVNGTPTFFINGIRHEGAPTYSELLSSLEDGTR